MIFKTNKAITFCALIELPWRSLRAGNCHDYPSSYTAVIGFVSDDD